MEPDPFKNITSPVEGPADLSKFDNNILKSRDLSPKDGANIKKNEEKELNIDYFKVHESILNSKADPSSKFSHDVSLFLNRIEHIFLNNLKIERGEIVDSFYNTLDRTKKSIDLSLIMEIYENSLTTNPFSYQDMENKEREESTTISITLLKFFSLLNTLENYYSENEDDQNFLKNMPLKKDVLVYSLTLLEYEIEYLDKKINILSAQLN